MARNPKRTLPSLCFLLLVVLSPSKGAAQSRGSHQTWQGYVTDTHCGTNCQVTKDMPPDKKCIDRCVRKGSKYGLWVGHHVYELEPQSKAAHYSGRDVAVTGALRGDTILFYSITTDKMAGHKKPENQVALCILPHVS